MMGNAAGINNLDFGMPTLIELANIEACVSVCKELGLRFVEINMNMPQYQIGKLDINSLKKAKDSGIYFTFHLDENFNIADFNNKVSQAYLDTILSVIEISKAINAPVINMHMAEGVHFKLPHEKVYLFEKYNAFYVDALLKFRNICDKLLADSDIKICIENCDGYLPFMEKGIALLLKSDVFQLTYDIGHDYCAKKIDQKFIFENKKRIYHMHIHDAEDDKCHLILGSGKMDIKNSLSMAYSQNCRCVIETKNLESLKKSVSFLHVE